MTTVDATLSPPHVELGREESERVLRQAASQRDAVYVASNELHFAATGRIHAVTDDFVELWLNDASVNPGRGSSVRVRITGGRESYEFNSEVNHAVANRSTSVLKLRRPEKLAALRRRRFWRTPLRESTAVQLTDADGALLGTAAMLNVSPDGFACRIPSEVAERVCIGNQVHGRFTLEGEPEPFDVRAYCRGSILGHSPEVSILRFQLDPQSMSPEVRNRIVRAVGVEVTRS